jgi:amino acid permease
MVYALVAIVAAGAVSRSALQLDQNILQNAAMLSIYPVFAGITFSASSSALGNLYCASKVLDAMAHDELFGVLLRPFKGRGKGYAPRAAMTLTWFFAQCGVLAGSVDVVAPVLTSIFLLAWAVINLTCAILSALGTPNWRPAWRYYSFKTAMAGFIVTICANL